MLDIYTIHIHRQIGTGRDREGGREIEREMHDKKNFSGVVVRFVENRFERSGAAGAAR